MELRIIFPNHYSFNLWGEIAKRSNFKQEIVNKINSIKAEDRTDTYINLDEPSLGLKVRGPENKLELKVRLDVKDVIEDWRKCIISNLSKFDKQTILKILNDHAQKDYQDPRIKNCLSKCIQLLQNCDNNLEKISFKLTKKRKQFTLSLSDLVRDASLPPTKHTLIVEQTDFETTPSSGTGKWKSICFEGADEQTLKAAYQILLSEFVNASINNGNKVYRMGYPQWIASILKPSLHTTTTTTTTTTNDSIQQCNQPNSTERPNHNS
jgi:hypothetical protein